ncbi:MULTISPECIES: cell envelope integrity EipB family protein [unclassified Sinorhizobium]|uniref:cell envelope integrity EipB family protein n=1 Tax=unclassified Sinorhizobium TaxID=2613772 RepID=UPI0024C2C3E1|nr:MULTISPECIES: cell envelope integrity EipB family protein [unclassified Sinorhizobium]MDK1376653.1 cell envelope integrity EipB family protein [Sinorhizobium sp. 6-70]MDK1482022.1 cell envelope integrity EipB family protein [Sinorhizobium sp. 6-117]
MFRTGFGLASFGSVCLVAMTALGAGVADAGVLAPHRAVYDLELKDASDRSGISSMYGRMVYEFNGSACEGYTVSFRFMTQVDTGEEVRLTDQQTTTYEDMRNRNFRFLTRSFTDEKLDKEVRGSAHEDKTGVKVELTAPDKREVALAESRFPTEHMLEVIDRAKKGDAFFESRIFDGSDTGDKTLITSTFVGKPRKPRPDDADAGKAGKLAAENYWPVTISYFNDDRSGDAQPIYSMSFKLYENGVTRDLTMDYGDFVLTGKLANLEVFNAEDCK